MIRINLLPVRAAQKKEKLLGQLAVLLLAAVVVIVACSGVYVALAMKIGTIRAEIAQTEGEIGRLKKTIGEVGHFKKLQEELQGKLDVLAELKMGKTGPVHLLDELNRALPEKLWLTSFKETGGNIVLSGIGLDEETVASFLRQLELSPYYQKVELQVIEQTAQGGLKLQKFDVTCRAETPPQS